MKQQTTTALAVIALTLAACSSDNNKSSSATNRTVSTESATTLATTSSSSTRSTSATNDTTNSSASSGSTNATSGSTDDTATASERADEAKQALKDGNFSAMLQALNLSGLADELNGREVTILAPTDAAFKALSGTTISDVLTDPGKAKDILRRHILDGVYSFDELQKQTSVKTIGGDTLQVSNTGGKLTIDGGTVTESDSKFDGTNGQEMAVFAIDRVLVEGG